MISISVIIPCYNASETIVDTIKSVAGQLYPPKEILVIDDCSSDDTLAKLEKLKKNIARLQVIKTDRNYGGPARPRNIGVKIATSEYVAFLDSDDLWHPELLEIYSKYLNSNYSMISSTKINFKRMQRFTDNEVVISNMVKNTPIKSRKIAYEDLLNRNLIVNSSVLISREILLDIMFEEGEEYVAVEDFIAWCKIHKRHGPSLHLDLQMVGYRVDSNSLSANKFLMFKKRIIALNNLGLTKFQIILRIKNFILYHVLRVLNIK